MQGLNCCGKLGFSPKLSRGRLVGSSESASHSLSSQSPFKSDEEAGNLREQQVNSQESLRGMAAAARLTCFLMPQINTAGRLKIYFCNLKIVPQALALGVSKV